MDLSCVVAKLISVFSGYNDASIIIYSPKKIIKSYYRCDKRFHLDEILDMYSDSYVNYGIVLISGNAYRCYLLCVGTSHREFKLLNSDTIHLQKTKKKGGQSAPRFERIRQEKKHHYTKKK